MSEIDQQVWDNLAHKFEIRQARIVAMVSRDGGAIVENVRQVCCREGRLFNANATKVGEVHTLEYAFTFSSAEKAQPSLSKVVQARIVVTGHHANGQWIEVRGNGLIGYDEAGNVEGLFDPLPSIITEKLFDGNPEEDNPPPASAEGDYPLPPQFLQATRSAQGGLARRQALRAAQALVKRGR